MMALKDFIPSFMRVKETVPAPVNTAMVPYGFLAMTGGEIQASDCWNLYKTVGTLAKVVDLIADQVSHIDPIIEIDGAPAAEHPISKLIEKPGYNRDRRRFIKEICVQELVTGTFLVGMEGNSRYVPVSMDVYPTKNLSVLEGSDGWPDTYQINESRRTHVFRREQWRNEMRYVSNRMLELIVGYDIPGDIKGIGLSRLQSIRADVILKLASLQHNTNLMQRGATLSGILNFKERVAPETAEALIQEFRRTATGAANAGGVMITGGAEMDWKPTTISNKDMEWGSLIKLVDDAIIARYGVPTTIYDSTVQTYDNFLTGWEQLYEQAVIPTFTRVYGSIASAMSARTGSTVTFRLNRLQIDTLAQKAVKRAIEMHEGSIITTNEAREIVGYGGTVGGDQILALSQGDGYGDLSSELIGTGRVQAERRPSLAGPKAPTRGRANT